MHKISEKNNVDIFWETVYVNSIIKMILDHFSDGLQNTGVFVNSCIYDVIEEYRNDYPDRKIIFYNLEHKYEFDPQTGQAFSCTEQWETYFRGILTLVDEIWDFSVENYLYFNNLGQGHKFKFIPLRYTSWFEQFIINKQPRYDIQFEGVANTQIRLDELYLLTSWQSNGVSLNFKLSNTSDIKTKFDEKQDAKYSLDLPRFNLPETINMVRIWENICINHPVISLDLYKIGSRKYFDDLCYYWEDLNIDELVEIINKEPPKNIAQRFKDMTYTNESYERYRRDILNDFRMISGESIPDSIL